MKNWTYSKVISVHVQHKKAGWLRSFRMYTNCFSPNLISAFLKNKNDSFFLIVKNKLKLSAVRKVLETLLFLALGSFESKTVRGTVLAWAQKLKSEGA